MNLPILQSEVKTMSSREIAQLCQKPHDNVLKLIRSLIDGGIVKSTTPHQYMHPQNGQWYTEFLSDKRDSLVVVARLSPEFTAAVIDRWQELETQNNALPNFADPVQAARAWADAMERQQQAIAQVAELQPKAQALDAITHAKGNSNIRDTAKALGAKQSDFISWCLKHGWLYRDDCERLKAYANRIQQGFMAQKSVLYRGSDSTERATMQPMFTPKGLTHLAKIYTREVA